MLIAMMFAEYLRHKVIFYTHCFLILSQCHRCDYSLGGDSWSDYCSDLCYDSAESAVFVSQSVLGGVHLVLDDSAPAQRQRGWGRLPH